MMNAFSLNAPQVQPAVAGIPSVDVVGCDINAACRRPVQEFVRKGFYQWYRADVQDFLPLLVSARAENIHSVLGLRTNTEQMMVTRYLDLALADALESLGITDFQGKVAEIGNLYSESHTYTLPLLLTTVKALREAGFNYALFTATTRVQALFMRYGLQAQAMCEANPDKLNGQASGWGSYYQAGPTVMLLDLARVASVVESNKRLSDIDNAQQSAATVIASQIRWLRHA